MMYLKFNNSPSDVSNFVRKTPVEVIRRIIDNLLLSDIIYGFAS